MQGDGVRCSSFTCPTTIHRGEEKGLLRPSDYDVKVSSDVDANKTRASCGVERHSYVPSAEGLLRPWSMRPGRDLPLL